MCLDVFTIPPASKHLSNINLKANIKFSPYQKGYNKIITKINIASRKLRCFQIKRKLVVFFIVITKNLINCLVLTVFEQNIIIR